MCIRDSETDDILRKQVEKIIERYGYKFINVLDADIYVSAMHDTYINNVYFCLLYTSRCV